MTTLSDGFSGTEEFDSLAREIAAQLAHSPHAGGGAVHWAVAPPTAPQTRPQLTNVLTSVSRAADSMAVMRADLTEALDRAAKAERRVASLEADLSEIEHRLDAAALQHDAENAGLRERLFEAQSRAQQAEESLQHLLRVVLDKLKP